MLTYSCQDSEGVTWYAIRAENGKEILVCDSTGYGLKPTLYVVQPNTLETMDKFDKLLASDAAKVTLSNAELIELFSPKSSD